MKKTFVVNFGTLSKMGGIESILYSQISFMVSQGVRVIWLKNEHSTIFDGFKNVLLSRGVEIANVSKNHIYWFKHESLRFDDEEEIVVVSFTIIDMIRALSLRNSYKRYNIKCLYCVPDTTGKFFFLEEYFGGRMKGLVYKKIRKTLQEWNDAGLIVFCAYLHITTFEEHYKIDVINKEEKLLPLLESPLPLDKTALLERSKRLGDFNIVTTGRFDFPHKGYMLGLVRAFARLKVKYPQIKLTIIGKGPHENLLKEEITKTGSFSRDIRIVGEVAHDKLKDYYRDMHLSVAVAGAASDAARLGVVSIVARNFCEGECEVYGFLPEMQGKTVSKEPGNLVDPFIEEVISMSEDEYYKRCESAYEAIKYNALGIKPNPWYFFDMAGKSNQYCLKYPEMTYWKIINYLRKMLIFIKR